MVRLYNPYYKTITKGQKTKNVVMRCLFWLSLLGGIAGVICLIVFKFEWYYWVGCASAAIVLMIVFGCLGAPAEYIDIDDNPKVELDPPEKVVIHTVDDDPLRKSYSVYGIRGGIAVCKCGKPFDPKNIEYSVHNVRNTNTFDEYDNMRSRETGTLVVECKCEKCGETYLENIDIELSTYSSVRKNEMFSDKTTIETKRTKTDVDDNVLKLYEYDKKKYDLYYDEYKRYVKKQEDKNEKLKDSNLKRIEELKTKGWYEKSDNDHM